jgi:hypothetical protein
MNAQKRFAHEGFSAAVVLACPTEIERILVIEILDAALSALLAHGDARYALAATTLQTAILQELPAQPAALRFAKNVIYVSSEHWQQAIRL